MDPEVIAQLEEQFRELTEMLIKQNSMMGDQIDAMNKMASSTKAATDTTNKNSANSTQATTKYAEAQAKASIETTKSATASKALAAGLGTLTASVSAAANVFGSLSSSLLSTEQGLSKYGKVADSAAQGLEGLVKSVPVLGDAFGGLVGVAGKLAAGLFADGMKLIDTFTSVRDGLVQVGGALPVTGEQLIKLSNNAGYFGERMQILGKITAGLGTNLAGISMTAGQGAVKFMEMSAVTDEVRAKFGKMGVDVDRLTEMQGMYIKSQLMSGNANELQAKSSAQLRKESLVYVENMTKLSALTGKQAEQMQAEQEVALSEYEELVKQRQENAKVAQLIRDGRTEEAAQIKKEQKTRTDFLKEAVAVGYSAAEVAKLGRMARTGVYDEFTGGMAVLGINAAKLKRSMETATDGAAVFADTYQEINQKTGEMALRAGDALQFMGEEGGNMLGMGKSFLETNRLYGDKNLAQAKEQAAALAKEAQTRDDALGDLVEGVKIQERAFQEAYQNLLLNMTVKIAKFLEGFDLFGFITNNFSSIVQGLGTVMGIAAAASVALSVAAGRAALSLAGVTGGGAAGGGLLRGAAGLAGRAAPWLSGLMVGKDAYDWATSDGPAKKEDIYGTVGGVLGGAVGLVGGPVGAAIGAGIGNAIGNWLGGKKDAAAGAATPGSGLAKIMESSRTGIYDPANIGLAFQDNSEVIEEQLKKNRELYNPMLQEATKENEERTDNFDLLSSSMLTFKNRIDSINKSLLELKKAADKFYTALTGQAAPDAENDISPTTTPPPVLNTGEYFTGKANSPATVESVMSMNLERESSGGTQLRSKFKQAGGIGGAYGLSQSARQYAYSNMTDQEKAEFKAATGFERPPTLEELVNKEGTAFLSDKAQTADRMLAKKFTETTIGTLTKKLGRTPSLADVRGSYWHGQAGYVALLEAAKTNPNMTMADFYAAHPNFGKTDVSQFKGRTVQQQLEEIAKHAGGNFSRTGLIGATEDFRGKYAGVVPDNVKLQSNVNMGSVDQDIVGRLYAAARDYGQPINITSGYRDDAYQALIWLRGQMGEPGIYTPARPMNDQYVNYKGKQYLVKGNGKGSPHLGRAIDIDVPGGRERFDEYLTKYGLHRPNKDGDPPHVEKAARGGIFRGPNSGYQVELHGTEMIIPLDNYRTNSSRAAGILNQLMNKTGERTASVGRYGRIQDTLMQVVNAETTKAIKAVSDSNAPMQNISVEITNSMRKVMSAHGETMSELTSKLDKMIDALDTSNDVTRKILKKASV